jgi:hypothetical protein
MWGLLRGRKQANLSAVAKHSFQLPLPPEEPSQAKNLADRMYALSCFIHISRSQRKLGQVRSTEKRTISEEILGQAQR